MISWLACFCFLQVMCGMTSTWLWFRATLTREARPLPKTWRWPCLCTTRTARNWRYDFFGTLVFSPGQLLLSIRALQPIALSLIPHSSACCLTDRHSYKTVWYTDLTESLRHLSTMTDCNIAALRLIDWLRMCLSTAGLSCYHSQSVTDVMKDEKPASCFANEVKRIIFSPFCLFACKSSQKAAEYGRNSVSVLLGSDR